MRLRNALVIALACLSGSGGALGAEGEYADDAWCRDRLWAPVEKPDPARNFALSLSGGGYRAMLYHIGALRRLNEAGLLAELAVVSSVSGGSITAGMLAKAWGELEFETRTLDAAGPSGALPLEVRIATNFESRVSEPLMKRLADTTIDVPAVVSGFFPGGSSADVVANRYDEILFGGAKLADLGKTGGPLFIFNATSLQTGELWQFRSNAMGGPSAGWTTPGETRLAQAVAASSAFPPFLSPLYLRPPSARADDWKDCRPVQFVHANDPRAHTRRTIRDEDRARYREEVYLTDGGVRDNLGMVAVDQANRRRINQSRYALDELISDGGRTFGFDPDPATNWLSQGFRVMGITSTEPDLLRIDAMLDRAISYTEDNAAHCALYRSEDRRLEKERKGEPSYRLKALCFGGDGAYWGVQRLPPAHQYFEPRPEPWIEIDDLADLGNIPTRLSALDQVTRERLVNWGYLSAHYGLGFINRLWQCSQAQRLSVCAMPYESSGVGPRTTTREYCLRPVKCDAIKPEVPAR
ncbi:MAG: hypothetical protein A3D95_13855 [Betaproteobacteria bacterium RIFCSPHIGHO2_12_FULL_69_13]|nr:MAG: hypothetical protein A3D95_13855 [Betaproteobacteria bacterium RIFCSPHIGHO2_12_FULL_69_13]OGA66537.1 MAG: hypothetical protein A3G83_09285 [Betaproteobacteria bacterium RIFCSPLOWO2_12_FULL_68_20]